MSGFVLTEENYYSREADMAYMSCSQYQGFLECEAKQLAKLQGRFVEEPSEAFLIGNYFHSYLESREAHEKFCEENFDNIFKTKTKTDKKTGLTTVTVTGKYAAYETADKMLAAAAGDPEIRRFIEMPGENEIFMTGELFGVPWKIKLDKYIPERRMIIDYKTCANIWETKYNPVTRERESFVDDYGYMMRGAVYTEIEKQVTGKESDAYFILICISKQDYPDKEIIMLNHKGRFAYELEQIKERIFRIKEIKAGRVLPRRCGVCDYCRSTKRLKGAIHAHELMPEFRREREEDYAIPSEMLASTPIP